MGYKLACEKEHRATKGGTRPLRIAKGEPFGRVLRTDYRPGYQDAMRATARDCIVSMHATKGRRVRSTRSMGWGQ